ncbi:hypothetical protein PITC_022530 [Penicillium italicum]|uniref:Uncharacterized protein n=1 Tax=Penicillium italicum TaxID=40296 RepID=A0A0A2KBU0_PENIT|nr:hypothetical protein PITC_022530 [Penicillium italicum]
MCHGVLILPAGLRASVTTAVAATGPVISDLRSLAAYEPSDCKNVSCRIGLRLQYSSQGVAATPRTSELP